MVPRVSTVKVELEAGEELCITPLSDLHIESSAFDLEAFNELMSERAKLPNHRALLLGDVMDLVVPVDLKRWRASVQDASLAGRDDWLNAGLDIAVERLTASGAKYDLVIPGNHEDEFKKRHGVDVTSMLARELRCPRGGYSGIIQYEPWIKCNGKFRRGPSMIRIAYHHGAWGGRVIKGFGGARDWFRAFDGWHIACYGHNHQTLVHREARFRVSKAGKLQEYPVYFVGTGSFVESYSEDATTTHYAERAGHMPTTRRTPLIRMRFLNHGGSNKRKQRGWVTEYTVEV